MTVTDTMVNGHGIAHGGYVFLLAEALTFVNLVGNCLATLVVARWEGALDQDILKAQLGRRHAASP